MTQVCSEKKRQVYLKESWRSTYLAKYAGSTSSMVLVEDLLEVYLKRSWTGILQAYLAKYAVSTTLLGSNHRPLEYMSTYKTTELLDLRTHISHKGPYYTYRVLFQVYFKYTSSILEVALSKYVNLRNLMLLVTMKVNVCMLFLSLLCSYRSIALVSSTMACILQQ